MAASSSTNPPPPVDDRPRKRSRRALDSALVASISALEMEVRCAICLERYDNPHYLSACKHVFCKDCCADALNAAEACPICRVPASRRSVTHDRFMEALVRDVQEPAIALQNGQLMDLTHPMPPEWKGKALVVDREPYVAQSAQPIDMREILSLREQIQTMAAKASALNAKSVSAAIAAAQKSGSTARS